MLALSQVRDGRHIEALMTLSEAIRSQGSSAQLHLYMGMILSRDGEFEQAAEHFRQAIQCDCSCPEAHYYLGLCLAWAGEVGKAVRQLERAHALRPHTVVWAYQLAMTAKAAAEKGLHIRLDLQSPSVQPSAGHLDDLAEYVASEVDFVTAFLALPVSEADAEIFTLLSAVLTLSLEKHGEYADLHHRQSLVLARLGQHVPAVDHARQAVEINPQYVQARIQLADLLADEQPASAVEHLLLAVKAGGSYADVHADLGQLYERLDQPASAVEQFHQSLQINANYPRASEGLKRLVA